MDLAASLSTAVPIAPAVVPFWSNVGDDGTLWLDAGDAAGSWVDAGKASTLWRDSPNAPTTK